DKLFSVPACHLVIDLLVDIDRSLARHRVASQAWPIERTVFSKRADRCRIGAAVVDHQWVQVGGPPVNQVRPHRNERAVWPHSERLMRRYGIGGDRHREVACTAVDQSNHGLYVVSATKGGSGIKTCKDIVCATRLLFGRKDVQANFGYRRSV